MEDNPDNYKMIPTLITAGLTLLGVIIGVAVTSFTNWKIKSKESRLRILEKIFDRRLQAHEDFLEVPKFLRAVITTKETDHNGILRTYTGVLATKEMFESFLGKYFEKVNFNSHWFENELNREVWITQEYLQNINNLVDKNPEDKWLQFAEIVKPDFTMFAKKLEDLTLAFLQIDIHNVKDKRNPDKFEYSQEEGQRILEQTEFYKNRDQILAFIP